MSCIELDKFEAVSDEEELVRRGMKLIKSNKLWAGLVFLDVKEGKKEKILRRLSADLDNSPQATLSCRNFCPTRSGWTRTRWTAPRGRRTGSA